MKMFERATVEQERASPRTFPARRLGYACLILIALVSRDAVAQQSITLTYLPGETTKTLVAPAVSSFNVTYISPGDLVCDLPTAAEVNARLLLLAITGVLQQHLAMVETPGTASVGSISSSFNGLWTGGVREKGNVGASRTATIELTQLVNGPYTHTFAANCLTVPEARAGINEIRRIIRAHLGLPAPTN